MPKVGDYAEPNSTMYVSNEKKQTTAFGFHKIVKQNNCF